MRRQTVYPGQVPLETDILNTNKNVMVALGHMLQDMLGTSTLFSGLGCVPTAPAGMTVNVNPGRVYSYQATDTGAYSSLAADAHQIVKQGIILDATNFSCPAPTTAGYSINYLVQGAFQEVDGGAAVLPFYNASNPSQAYNGPNGTGASSNTYRDNTVQLSLKAGVAAATGTQVTPAPDSGFNGLWVITVPYGATSINSSNIAQYNGAPFLVNNLLSQIQSAPCGVAGLVRNFRMVLNAASASTTATADEIIVETALGGQTYRLANFSQTINLATTGAGGMDTGTAPVSGFVAIYAIYNPTTNATALLAQNANALRAQVYAGANMPAGYTASALVAVVPTNGSGQFPICSVLDREVYFLNVQALSSSTAQAGLTALSLATIVPLNARRISGNLSGFVGTSGANFSVTVFGSSAGAGNAPLQASPGATGATNSTPFTLPITTPQTVHYTSSISAGAFTYNIGLTGYGF